MHRYRFPLSPPPNGLLPSCLAWLPKPPTPLNFLSCRLCCVLSCLLPSCCLSLTTHNPFCSSSVCLCGFGLVMFLLWFLSCRKMSCCSHSSAHTVSNPRLVSKLTHPPKRTNLHHSAYSSTVFQPQNWSWKMLELCIWMKVILLAQKYFSPSVYIPQFL